MKNILAILALAVSTMSGCVKETRTQDQIPDVPQGMVRIEINTDGSEFQTPTTRGTANENSVDDVWVLVFKGSNYNNAIFVEAVKSTGTSPRYVNLTQAAGDHKLLVVANADAFIVAKKASLATQTLTQAIAILQYGNPYDATAGNSSLANIQKKMPFAEPAMSIPMSEVLSVSSISSVTEINATGAAGGSALELRRTTAKVVVDASAVYSKLVINQVAALQGGRSTISLVPGDGGAIQNSGTEVSYYKNTAVDPNPIGTTFPPSNATQNTTEETPIYIYESTGRPTYIIISGVHNGVPCFYKLRLKKADGTDYDIKRNYKYTFKIESIVDGVAGYSTLKEAIDGVESNIVGAVIEVKDGLSTDIIDNGTYYIATDCSEVVIYSSFAEDATTMGVQPLVCITTNATAAMIGGVNSLQTTSTATGALSVTNTGAAGALTLASGTTPVTTKVSLASLTTDFTTSTTGTITIKLGNLTKKIKVTRRNILAYGGLEAVGTATDKFTAGVVDPSTTLDGFGLSTDGLKDNAAGQFTATSSSGSTVYLCADRGRLTRSASPTFADTKSWGVAFLSRAGSTDAAPIRVKLLVRQDALKIDPIVDTYYNGAQNDNGYWPYVGAFWKHNEVGERNIAMENTTTSAWTAKVVDGVDWIELDLNYGTPNGSDINQSAPIGGGLTTVSGSGSEIQFRIGLKSSYTPTTAKPVRYGLVIVYYEGATRPHPVFIRQGEDPDYLMRPSDSNGDQTITNEWGGSAARPRPYAKQFSPYNLTAQAFLDGTNTGGALVSQHPQLAVRGGVFTKYPSQGGAFFQWAMPTANTMHIRRAFHLSNPVGVDDSDAPNNKAFTNIPAATNGDHWYYSPSTVGGFWGNATNGNYAATNETCPAGFTTSTGMVNFRRPRDGSITAVSNGKVDNIDSEMRQSLWMNPINGYNWAGSDNSLLGYYADGYFDRFPIGNPDGFWAASNSVVSFGTNDAAYNGRLFFNSNTNGSLFFPAAGFRQYHTGILGGAGYRVNYWTSSTSSSPDWSWALFSDYRVYGNGSDTQNQYPSGWAGAFTVRCVKE